MTPPCTPPSPPPRHEDEDVGVGACDPGVRARRGRSCEWQASASPAPGQLCSFPVAADKWPQTGCLQTTEIYSFMVRKAKRLKSRCCSFLKALGETVPCLPLTFPCCRQSLEFLGSASVVSWILLVCLCLHMAFSSLCVSVSFFSFFFLAFEFLKTLIKKN